MKKILTTILLTLCVFEGSANNGKFASIREYAAWQYVLAWVEANPTDPNYPKFEDFQNRNNLKQITIENVTDYRKFADSLSVIGWNGGKKIFDAVISCESQGDDLDAYIDYLKSTAKEATSAQSFHSNVDETSSNILSEAKLYYNSKTNNEYDNAPIPKTTNSTPNAGTGGEKQSGTFWIIFGIAIVGLILIITFVSLYRRLNRIEDRISDHESMHRNNYYGSNFSGSNIRLELSREINRLSEKVKELEAKLESNNNPTEIELTRQIPNSVHPTSVPTQVVLYVKGVNDCLKECDKGDALFKIERKGNQYTYDFYSQNPEYAIANMDALIKPFCEITKKNGEKNVLTLESGLANKNDDNTWTVIRKAKVEFK